MAEGQLFTLTTSLATLSRLQVDEHGGVVRVIHATQGSGPAGEQQLADSRGALLLQINELPYVPKEPIEAVVTQLRSQGVEEVTLVLQPDPFSAQDQKRQKSSALGIPETEITELSEDAMIPLLKSKGAFRKSVQSLQALPLGSCMCLNHPNWKLTSLGALVLLPPRALKELDLRSNSLGDVGPALSRFEALQELRISGNRLRQIELTFMPRLQLLDVSFNQLTALPELLGLPVLQSIDLSDNQLGTRGSNSDTEQMGPLVITGESADGWERLAHSPLADLRCLLLANNLLNWTQPEFNSRIALLREKRALQELDLRGNSFAFFERSDGRAPITLYREWILTQCTNLKKLDHEARAPHTRHTPATHPPRPPPRVPPVFGSSLPHDPHTLLPHTETFTPAPSRTPTHHHAPPP